MKFPIIGLKREGVVKKVILINIFRMNDIEQCLTLGYREEWNTVQHILKSKALKFPLTLIIQISDLLTLYYQTRSLPSSACDELYKMMNEIYVERMYRTCSKQFHDISFFA